MAIDVVCPGCKKAFRVSDQFAGKKGPCPACKVVITIPTVKTPEIVIHAPEMSGPKGASGQPVLKPIRRKETKISLLMLGAIIGGVVLAIVAAVVVRMAVPNGSAIHLTMLAVGAIVLAPLLVMAGYSFLRDQELEPYRGTTIMLRVAACSAVYALIWGLYAYIPGQLEITDTISLTFIIPIMIGLGALAAFASLDLSFGSAAVHYGLYLIVTLLLCLLTGFIPWTMPT